MTEQTPPPQPAKPQNPEAHPASGQKVDPDKIPDLAIEVKEIAEEIRDAQLESEEDKKKH